MKIIPKKPFRSAKTEVKSLIKEHHNTAYRLAFLDEDFLLREELRPVRLQLELLKPELIQQDEHIESTVVIFGSARIPEPEQAKAELSKAKLAFAANPTNVKLAKAVNTAEHAVAKSRYYDEARKLGRIISEYGQQNDVRNFVVVTGGGPGIMEAANRGAYDVNAKNIGLNIVLPHEQNPNQYISKELCFRFHYFAIRKMHFLIRARALVCFPGGYGTLDELFETLTLLQNKKIKPMPLLLVGKSYWNRLINFEVMVEEGMIAARDIKLFSYVETAEEAWQAIQTFYQEKMKEHLAKKEKQKIQMKMNKVNRLK